MYPPTFISELSDDFIIRTSIIVPDPELVSVSLPLIKDVRWGGQKSSVLKVSPPSHPLRPVWQGTGVKTCMCESCHILVNLLTGFHPSTLKDGIDFVILFCFSTLWKCPVTYLLHFTTELHLLFFLLLLCLFYIIFYCIFISYSPCPAVVLTVLSMCF